MPFVQGAVSVSETDPDDRSVSTDDLLEPTPDLPPPVHQAPTVEPRVKPRLSNSNESVAADVTLAEQQRGQPGDPHLRRRLQECETRLETGMEAARDALRTIHDERLYRVLGHKSFDAYLTRLWGISRQYGHRLVVAAEVDGLTRGIREDVSPKGVSSLPETHAREMAPLRNEPELLRQVAERHGRGELATATAVRRAVQEVMPSERPSDEPPAPELINPPPEAAAMIEKLEKLQRGLATLPADDVQRAAATNFARRRLMTLVSEIESWANTVKGALNQDTSPGSSTT
jgi:hypothetical protein